MTQTALNINSSVINAFIPIIQNVEHGRNLEEKFRLSLSIGLFVEKVISLEKAAELAGKTMSQFVDILISRNISWNEYTQSHFAQDESSINKYLQDKDS